MKLKDFLEMNMDEERMQCPVCKHEVDQYAKDTVSDVAGNLYHRKCFDKYFGNEELKKRRTDNQLPD